jgi:hypothetical protein
VSRDFEDGASKLTTTHLEMAEPFARVLGPFRISVDGFDDTRVGPRPRMALRAKPPEGLFQQYSRRAKGTRRRELEQTERTDATHRRRGGRPNAPRARMQDSNCT